MSFNGTTNNNVYGPQTNVKGTHHSYSNYPQGRGPVQNNYGYSVANGGSVINGDFQGTMNHGMPSYPPPGQSPTSPMMNRPWTEEPGYMDGYDNGPQTQGSWSEPNLFSEFNDRSRYRQGHQGHQPHYGHATRPSPNPLQTHAATAPPNFPQTFGNPWEAYQTPNYAPAQPTRAPSVFHQGSYGNQFDPNAQASPSDSGYGSSTASTDAQPDKNPFRRLVIEDKRRNTDKPYGYAQ